MIDPIDYRPEPALWVVIAVDEPAEAAGRNEQIRAATAPIVKAAGGVVVASATYPGVAPLGDLGCQQLIRDNPDGLYQRERLLNLAIAEVPDEVEYIAWLEAGAVLDDPRWLTRCVDQLRGGAQLVRLFDQVAGSGQPPCPTCRRDGAFGWAAPRAMTRTLGLYDRALTGDNSRLIAHALTGQPATGCLTARLGHGTPSYRDYEAWAHAVVVGRTSTLTGTIHRAVGDRDMRQAEAELAIRQIRFDPVTDLEIADDGMWRLAGDRDDLAEWLQHRRVAPPPATLARHADDLTRAATLISTGSFDAAEELLQEVFNAGVVPSQSLRLLGKVASRRRDFATAALYNEEALSCIDADVLAHLDLADAMLELECDEWLPVAELTCFADDVVESVEHELLERIETTADDRFDACRFHEAGVLYGLLLRLRPDDDASRLALAECQLRTGAARAAFVTFESGDAAQLTDADAIRLKARIHLGLGYLDTAAALLRRSLSATDPAVDAETLRVLIDVLARGSRWSELAALRSWTDGLEPTDLFELQLRVALLLGDDEAVAGLYQGAPDEISSAGDVVLHDEVRRLTESGDFAGIDRLMSLADRRYPLDNDLVIALIDSAMAQQEWDHALELLAHAELVWVSDDDSIVKLHRLMVDCLRLDLEAAAARVVSWSEIPVICSGAVAALYAAQGRWEDVLELLGERIGQGINISGEAFVVAITKATRHTGRYSEVVGLIDEALATWPIPPIHDLRDRLVAEATVAEAAGRVIDPPVRFEEIERVRYARRSAAVVQTLRAEPVRTHGDAVFLCTDRNYLVGTVVALASLLRNNPGIANRAKLHVVTSDDALDLAGPIVAQLSSAYGATIRLQPASELDAGDQVLRTSWGSFTPGHGLSDAAYYRIFMAAKLLRSGVRGRALYLDSDVIVGAGIDRLLATDLGGQPVGVRRELPLPVILAAARRLGVPEDSYFNSGVLLFDLDHPDLADRLARSLDFAAHKPELLSFVDQCALNIGFLGGTGWLPPEANYFLREQDQWTLDREPTVLHFLANPKPWDPSYRSDHANRWVREFEMLGQIIDAADLRAVMAALFPAGQA